MTQKAGASAATVPPGADDDTMARGAAQIAHMRPMLLRLARLQLRNEAWAEDAVSETMVAAVEGLAGFERKAQLKTWVVGILKHKIIDQFRRSQREVPVEPREDPGGADHLEEAFRADGHRVATPLDWGDPEEQFSRGEFLAVLQACLDKLPAQLARAFLLREWLECETPEICKELGVSATNCFVMLYRARLRLRECLDVNWFALPEGRRGG